jgi:hypothetical protein
MGPQATLAAAPCVARGERRCTMGLFDFLTSTRRPSASTPVMAAGEVRARLLALNRPTAPYRVVDGADEGVDLIAEWKIVDAAWYELFAKAGLAKVFRIYLRLDPQAREVRAQDREYEVAWRPGVPALTLTAQAFRGQKQSIEFGGGYAFTEMLAPGQVFNYRFATKELKEPLQEAVTSCGWTYRGVAFGKA